MKALVLTASSQIELKEVPKPTLSPGKALVRVKAAALNRRDDWIREGKYPGIRFGVTMGSDGAGIVEEVTDESNSDWVGQEVVINPNIDWGPDPEVQSKNYTILGMPVNGTFAEYIVVDVDRLQHKPFHLYFLHPAAFPLWTLPAFPAFSTR